VMVGITLFRRPANEVLLLTTLCSVALIPLYHPHYDLVVLLIPLFLLLYRKAAFDPLTRWIGVVGIGAVFFLNRLTTLVITVLPSDMAALTARVVLFVLFGLYYAVAIRLLLVVGTTTSNNEGKLPLVSSSQGGA
jgi:hypothetical protein